VLAFLTISTNNPQNKNKNIVCNENKKKNTLFSEPCLTNADEAAPNIDIKVFVMLTILHVRDILPPDFGIGICP
jgi:hypothetical protein